MNGVWVSGRRAVQTDDEAVADQRVVAHALNLHEVFQTFGVGGRGGRQRGASKRDESEGAAEAGKDGTHDHHGDTLRKKRCNQPMFSASLR